MPKSVKKKRQEKTQDQEEVSAEECLSDQRDSDPDWTPGAEGKASRSGPGLPQFYNLRDTVKARLWDGSKFKSDPTDRVSRSRNKGEEPDTPFRRREGSPSVNAARRSLFQTEGQGPSDTRPEFGAGTQRVEFSQSSKTSSQNQTQVPQAGECTSPGVGETLRIFEQSIEYDARIAERESECLIREKSLNHSSSPFTGAMPASQEGAVALTAAAAFAGATKDAWIAPLQEKWADTDTQALEAAVPALNEFLTKLFAVNGGKEGELYGSAGLGTRRDKVQKSLGKESLSEKVKVDALIARVNEVFATYEELWQDRTDITAAFHSFKGSGFTVLGDLVTLDSVISLVHDVPAAKLSGLYAKIAEDGMMDHLDAVSNLTGRWGQAFNDLGPKQSASSANLEVPVESIKKENETQDVDHSMDAFKAGLTAPMHRPSQQQEQPSKETTHQEEKPKVSAPEGSTATGRGSGGGNQAAGSGDPNPNKGNEFCALCFRPGHTAENCPGRPSEGKGPYCIHCKKVGHSFYECPHGRFAVPCQHCGDVGHFDKDCPFEKARKRRMAQREPKSYEEARLFRKAGIPLSPTGSEKGDSDVEEIPREEPQEVLRRQMKERKRLETERQVRKLKREEERLASMQWADLYRIRDDIMVLLTGRNGLSADELSTDQQKELNQALVTAYIQQQTKGPRALDQGATVAASLKDLGIDGLLQYDGNEAKYPVKSFIHQVDEVKGFKKWPNPTAAIAMGKLLIGNAKDWYDVLKAENHQETPEYNKLKLALLKQFYKKITLVEKALAMNSLKFDVAKHGSHLNFLTECEKQMFLISDMAYSLEGDNELITRKQAREEQTLLVFLANSAPLIRWECDYHGAETKSEIKAVIRRFEDALRAKENTPRHALLPGYRVNEISKPTPSAIQKRMESFGYSPMEINAVLKGKAAKSGSSEVIQCYYCATVGHRRNECGQLEEDTKKGQIRPDKCGPRAGQAPHVESLSKKKPNAKDKKSKASGKSTGAKKKTFSRKKKVNAVEASDSEEDSDDAEVEEELTDPRSTPKPNVSAANQAPGTPWTPWMPPYPGHPGWPPFASTARPALEAPQTAEVSLTQPQVRSAYDLI